MTNFDEHGGRRKKGEREWNMCVYVSFMNPLNVFISHSISLRNL